MTNFAGVQNLAPDTVVVASPQQVSCDVATEAVLLSMRDGQYYGLNEVAACIWRLVQEPRTVLQLREALLEEYEDIDPIQCDRAVMSFLEEMIALELVERR
ncbi:MAG: PqqD family protein [Gemmatimonadaceae bacterium]